MYSVYILLYLSPLEKTFQGKMPATADTLVFCKHLDKTCSFYPKLANIRLQFFLNINTEQGQCSKCNSEIQKYLSKPYNIGQEIKLQF